MVSVSEQARTLIHKYIHHEVMVVRCDMCDCMTDVGTVPERSEMRIMTLVHLNFCQSVDSLPPHPVTHTTTVHSPSPQALAVHHVEIPKRVNAVHGHRCMGTHTAWRTSHNAAIRGSSTEE
jgi:hypothetical protein